MTNSAPDHASLSVSCSLTLLIYFSDIAQQTSSYSGAMTVKFKFYSKTQTVNKCICSLYNTGIVRGDENIKMKKLNCESPDINKGISLSGLKCDWCDKFNVLNSDWGREKSLSRTQSQIGKICLYRSINAQRHVSDTELKTPWKPLYLRRGLQILSAAGIFSWTKADFFLSQRPLFGFWDY